MMDPETLALPEMPPPPVPSSPPDDSQTQDTLHMVCDIPNGPEPDCGLKRRTTTDRCESWPNKKMKISVGPAVDLGD